MTGEHAPETKRTAPDAYQAEAGGPSKGKPRFECLSCGYDLRGLAVGEPCPECGKVISLVYDSDVPPSAFASWSLVFGIVAFPSCLLFGVGTFVAGILAIVFWWVARKQVRERQSAESSMTAANAGLICAIIAMSFVGVFWIVVW